MAAHIASGAPTLAASNAPDPAALHGALQGRWSGQLAYRDYQTNQVFMLPVTEDIRMVADKVTEVQAQPSMMV